MVRDSQNSPSLLQIAPTGAIPLASGTQASAPP